MKLLNIEFLKKYYDKDIIVSKLKNITELRLSFHNLTEIEQGSFQDLVNLHILDLYSNSLTVIKPGLFDKLVNLRTLKLSANTITAIEPGSFRNLVNLQTLDLSYNNLTVIEPGTFRDLVDLQILKLYNNNITVIEPSLFETLTNLQTLDLCNNKITVIEPDTFKNLFNLRVLRLYNNDITNIEPGIFDTLIDLETLSLYKNNLTEIKPNTFNSLINLQLLNLSENKLTAIEPGTFRNLVNLQTLYLSYNNLSYLPIEIIDLRNLREFYHDNNPVTVDIIIERFLNKIKNKKTTIYSDAQSVHNYAIQESVRISVMNILKDKTPILNEVIFKTQILEDDVLTQHTKSFLIEYCADKTIHSNLFITFEDLLKRVWNRIINHLEKEELKRILNQEMKEAECKCFTGRISRLINVLNGYFDDIVIQIPTGEQIAYVITSIQEKLIKEGNYTAEKHRELAILELKERGYEEDIIKVWTGEI